MGRVSFAELDLGNIELRDGFSLDTLALEEQMLAHNGGIELQKLKPEDIRDDSFHRTFVPYYGEDQIKRDDAIRLSRNSTKPFCLEVTSLRELREHMSRFYQMAHHHYIIGKNRNMHGSFPHNCCGTSARGIMVSLLNLGYLGAAYAYATNSDHGYVTVPFLLMEEKDNIKGSVIIDPTSDQLWRDNGPRNAVIIKTNSIWTYKTDWDYGADLFPDAILSLDRLKRTYKELENTRKYYKGGKNYFDKAFANPIKFAA